MRTERIRIILRMCYGYSLYLLFTELCLITLKCPASSPEAMLVLGFLFAGSYYLRCRVSRVWPLMLYSVICGVGIWFLPEIVLQKLLLSGADLGLFAMGIRHVVRGGVLPEAMEIPWPGILLGAISVVSGLYYDYPQLTGLALLLTLINIILFLLILYADSGEQYLHSNKNVQGLPIRKMLRINTLIVAGIIILMIAGIVIGELTGLPDAVEDFFKTIGNLLKALLYGFVLAVKWIGNIFTGRSGSSVSDARITFLNQLKKTNDDSNIIFTILRFALLGLFLLLLLRFLARFFRLLMVKYQQNGKSEVIRGVKDEERERLQERGLGYRLRTYFTLEERARRIYRKRILDAAGDAVPLENATTGDILYWLNTEKGVNLPELTQLYEAVRYGGIKVDQAYLRKMKNADMPQKRKVNKSGGDHGQF